MLKILEAKGIGKLSHETPAEFAKRVGDPYVDEVTRLYHMERFGGQSPLEDELAGVLKALEEVRKKQSWGQPAGGAARRSSR